MTGDQIVNLGEHDYRVLRTPVELPAGVSLSAISDVAVFNEQVVVLRRRSPELLVFSLDGLFLKSVGFDDICLGHGLRALGADILALTDVDGHQVLLLDAKFDVTHILHCDNRPKLGQPFNHPTDCARDSTGRYFVSDGYGNSQVHVFTAAFSYSHSIGHAGTSQGAFSTPHALAILPDDRVVVADRENNRLQIFAPDGTWQQSIPDVYKPMAVEVIGGRIFVTDQTPRLSVFSIEGKLLGRCRTFSTYGHGMAVSAGGNIYIADMAPDGLTKLEKLK